MPQLPLDPNRPHRVTPWDRRVVGAMNAADSARTGVVVLRLIAAVSMAAAVVGNYLYIFGRDFDGSSEFEVATPDRFTVGQFLGNIATPIAFAGIVVAMSFLLAVYAARLDLDIVLSDEQESGSTDETDGA